MSTSLQPTLLRAGADERYPKCNGGGNIKQVYALPCYLPVTCMPLAKHPEPDFTERHDAILEVAHDGWVVHRLARRAHVLVLLDDGMSYAAISREAVPRRHRSAPGCYIWPKAGL